MMKKKCLIKYIIKKTRKKHPSWRDINELQQAVEKDTKEILDSGINSGNFKTTLKKIRHNREKIGVLVSFVHPEDTDFMAIGYSLCNTGRFTRDIFDKVLSEAGYKSIKDFGFQMAMNRAIKWHNINANKSYLVPPSIKEQFKNFVIRSHRYYKDKKIPEWVKFNFDGSIE